MTDVLVFLLHLHHANLVNTSTDWQISNERAHHAFQVLWIENSLLICYSQTMGTIQTQFLSWTGHFTALCRYCGRVCCGQFIHDEEHGFRLWSGVGVLAVFWLQEIFSSWWVNVVTSILRMWQNLIGTKSSCIK